jgi:hypothetical protein
MKIAILSDSHDNLTNFKKAISWIKKEKIKILIHCGDIFEPETIKEALKGFSGKAHFVLSNVDEDYFENLEKDYFKDFPNLKIWREFGEIEILKKTTTRPPPSHSPKASGPLIAFCHSPKTAFKLAFSQKYDIIFYGHLHKPWEVRIKKTKLVNPGNIASLFFRASFAIYDTKSDKLKLKILQ